MRVPRVILACVFFAARLVADPKPLALSGLTDGLAAILSSRPPIAIKAGTGSFSIESFFAEDFAGAFRLDSVIREYLDASGDAPSYEALAYALRARLSESIDAFVVVEASTVENRNGEETGMRIGIYLSAREDVSLPLRIRSDDGRLSADMLLPCDATLEFGAELFMDAGIVIGQDYPRGLSFRLNYFDMALRYSPEDPFETREAVGDVVVSSGRDSFQASVSELCLDAVVHYRLGYPLSGDVEATIDFEDIMKGDYDWKAWEITSLSLALEEKGVEPGNDGEARWLSYATDGWDGPEGGTSLYYFDGDETLELKALAMGSP